MTGSIAAIEDSTLIEMALAGQTECFSVLMGRHVSVVRSCIRSMVTNTTDVDDLVQDAFLKAWLHLSTFRFEASFRAWITRVAVNEALTLYAGKDGGPSVRCRRILKPFLHSVNRRTRLSPARKRV
jgi:RNA polymerase sigma factor (sigma-70 family)